jgi:HSP20 family protein
MDQKEGTIMAMMNRNETNEKSEMKDLSVQEKKELKQEQGTHQGAYFEPSVDIYETPKELVLVADIPGSTSEQLDVNIRDNVLTLTARVGDIDPRWKPIYQEYRLGHYSRQFRIGQQIDQAKINARIKDGVLTLGLPKAEAAQPRKITIQTQS